MEMYPFNCLFHHFFCMVITDVQDDNLKLLQDLQESKSKLNKLC